MSADKTSDTTFNRYVKFGAYTGLKGGKDDQLNQYEEVGYSPIVSGDAYKAGMAAYQNNGSATPTSPYSNSNAGTAAYNQGYNDAKNAENAGVQNFKNGTGKVSGTDTASQITNAAYDNAQKGFNDGVAGTTPTSNDPAYMAGHNAGDATKQAIADSKSGTTTPATPADSTAYADAKGAYANGAKAAADAAKSGTTPTQSTSSDPVYKQAYNQAIQDAADAQKQAIQDAEDNHGKDIDPTKSYSANSDVQALAKQAYADAQTGYKNALSGSTTTPTNAAQQSGSNAGTTDKAYADAEVNNTTPSSTPSTEKQQSVSDAITAAKKALAADPGAKDTLPADNALASDPLAAYTYKKYIDNATADYTKGINEAKAGTTPSDNASAAEKQGASDFTTGFNNGNGATNITNPNSGQQAGIDAAKSVAQGVEDAQKGTDDSNVTDPIQKEAATYANKAFTDYSSGGTPMSDDAVNALDPIAKAAYLQAKSAIQNAASNGAQEFLDGKNRPDTTTKTGATEAAGYDDAQSGYDAAKAGTPEDQLTPAQKADTNFMKGYQAYKDSQTGYNATTTPGSGASQAEQDGYSGAAAGTKDSIAGQPKADVSGKSKAYQDAYNNAYNQATDGYNDGYAAGKGGAQPDPTKQNDPNYMKGYNAGKSAQQAIADGEKGVTAPSTTPTDSDAYTNAAKAYADGANAAASGKTDPSTSTDPIYKAAYNQAINDTAAARQAAIKDATDRHGQDVDPTKSYSANPTVQADAATKQGADDFSKGLTAAVNGQTIDNPTSGEKAGAAAAKSFNQGYEDAEKGTDDSAVTDPVQKAAAAAAKEALTDYANGSPKGTDDINKMDPVSKAAYQKALDDAKGLATQGTNAFTNGTGRPDDSTPAGKVAAAAYDKAKQGYEDAVAGKTTDADKNDPSYQAGQKAYTDSQTGYNGTTTPADNASQPTKDAYNGATSGAADAVAGKAKPSDLATKSQAYQDAYNKAYDQAQKGMADATAGTQPTDAQKADPNYVTGYNAAQKAAQSGSQAYLNGQSRPDDSTPTGKAAAAAYDKAKQGYEDAAAGKTTATDQDDPAYQAGEKAYKDAQTGYNGTSAPADNASQQTKDAYNGATSGAADAVAGKAKPSDLATKSPAYQDAYNKAYDQAQKGMADVTAGTQPTDAQKADPNYMTGYNAAQKAADNGAQAFINGQARPDDSTPTGKAAAAAYDAAKNGYNGAATDAQSGKEPTDAEKNDPAYMKGYQAYKDSQTGYTGAGTDTKPAADAPQPAQDAYNGAIAGAKDGAAGASKESDLATKSQAYQDAYNKAYDDAAAGAKAGYQDGSQSGTPTDLTNKSAIYKQAYAAAKAKADAEATAGAADFAQGKSAPTTATAASQFGYDRAKAGFNDANAGKPAQANDAAYMAGYNAGLKHYTTTNNTAQDDALSGKGRQDANLNDADKAAYDQAYARTIAGLNDGANGAAKAFPDDANYLKGYAAGQAVKALLADKQNNTKTAVDDQASYDLANQAYLQTQDDVANGRAKAPNNQNPVYVLAYDLAYDQLLKEKEAQGTGASAQSGATTTDNVTPATKSSVLPATGEEKTAANNSGLILGLAASFLGLFAAAKRKRDGK
ncbi:hypothetical protein [Fructobacillus evanidus]|uniref:Gram-positive cocci surface proteins LPxTG domain-containing protein n=1 Tax=Fructobacillus evanidus TaxID=3064281 RepID=A0ABM9MYB1_9LACO|nr:hypothetical protein R53718_MFFEMHAI_01204 [Fructobacillus sp. LMG 32999]CAK1242002.1 hypothetical protein R55250_KEHBDPNM_01276 [Fructobacillus sp. LMG 32999]CAK1248374.1 hypothetical protein R54837_OMAIDLJD_01185 [Fructobacillus sp. LMG 32999]CAK1248812.1 hypothetical protein R55214_HHFBAMCI_01199 [Fructobacillus sp. LMG 32999]CAK1250338.1 hypothetical protein R55203_MFJFHIJN_01255 [Fructobacillus sp. LMG 32999]